MRKERGLHCERREVYTVRVKYCRRREVYIVGVKYCRRREVYAVRGERSTL